MRNIGIYILAADIGALLPVNFINLSILKGGAILLYEGNLAIIVGEVVGTVILTALNVAWLLNKIKHLSKKHQVLWGKAGPFS
jgi:hypothetical protein